MASGVWSRGPRQEEPVSEVPDNQPADPCPGPEDSPKVKSMSMALTSSVMSRASFGPSLALQNSPSSVSSSTTQLQPLTTPSTSSFSPSERSAEWRNWEQNSISLRSLADSYRGDMGLSQQLDRRLLQQLLRECPEWEQLLNPTLKTLLQSFLKSQYPRNPQEILLCLRDPQSEMRRLLQCLLGHFPYWQVLLDQSLRRILQQYALSQEQQPSQERQQGQTLQAYLTMSHQWQQSALGGQQSARGEQQPQMLQVYLPTFQYQQHSQVPQLGLGGQQGQMLQAHLPTIQYPQQPTQRGQQVQMLQAYLPTFQYPQQPAQGEQQGQTLQAYMPTFQYAQQSAQGGQQGQMLQAYLPTFHYVQQPQVPSPCLRGQQGQMLQACLPTYQQWQQQPELDRQQPQMLQAYLPTFQYPQQLNSADRQPQGLQTQHPPPQGSDG